VRWNGVPVVVSEAVQRALELNETTSIAIHGTDVYALS
jgi:hypothetical protein